MASSLHMESDPRPRNHPLPLVNGSSPLHVSVSAQEQDDLKTSIQHTHKEKRPVDLDGSDEEHADANGRTSPSKRVKSGAVQRVSPPRAGRTRSRVSAPARDSRDAAPGQPSPVTSRPVSPYTSHPPIDFDGLSWPSSGTRDRKEATPEEALARQKKLEGACRTILECVGEDPNREGLLNTPKRYAEALMHFTQGYEMNVRDLVNGAVFHEDHDELVIVKNVEIFSLCEHHMVPFVGKMHIGYIPNRRVIGLSKLGRLADMFAQRLQLQERLTKQVALAISEVLKPRGVGVVVESTHFCMVGRGVQKTGSSTVSSCMLGCMRKSAKTREEFLSLLK